MVRMYRIVWLLTHFRAIIVRSIFVELLILDRPGNDYSRACKSPSSISLRLMSRILGELPNFYLKLGNINISNC